MTRTPQKIPNRKRSSRGFLKTSGILHQSIRKVTEKRGFAETRLLTHWAEIVGTATAAVSRPIKVGYGREGMGATLTLLCNGANAPLVQAELPKIQTRVNAVYGYAAISRIRITQTSAVGFAEPVTEFTAEKPKSASPKQQQEIKQTVTKVTDDGLRQALENLGQKIISRNN